ncbi:hypothetical protein F5146DRAFT_725168 [Armillaria mellea]|nr:hypothetical protein F5146DRAFT_725168 [Armillaria mellea]
MGLSKSISSHPLYRVLKKVHTFAIVCEDWDAVITLALRSARTLRSIALFCECRFNCYFSTPYFVEARFNRPPQSIIWAQRHVGRWTLSLPAHYAPQLSITPKAFVSIPFSGIKFPRCLVYSIGGHSFLSPWLLASYLVVWVPFLSTLSILGHLLPCCQCFRCYVDVLWQF